MDVVHRTVEVQRKAGTEEVRHLARHPSSVLRVTCRRPLVDLRSSSRSLPGFSVSPLSSGGNAQGPNAEHEIFGHNKTWRAVAC